MNATELLLHISEILGQPGTDESRADAILALIPQYARSASKHPQSELTRAARAWARSIPAENSNVGKGAKEAILMLAEAVDALRHEMRDSETPSQPELPATGACVCGHARHVHAPKCYQCACLNFQADG